MAAEKDLLKKEIKALKKICDDLPAEPEGLSPQGKDVLHSWIRSQGLLRIGDDKQVRSDLSFYSRKDLAIPLTGYFQLSSFEQMEDPTKSGRI